MLEPFISLLIFLKGHLGHSQNTRFHLGTPRGYGWGREPRQGSGPQMGVRATVRGQRSALMLKAKTGLRVRPEGCKECWLWS